MFRARGRGTNQSEPVLKVNLIKVSDRGLLLSPTRRDKNDTDTKTGSHSFGFTWGKGYSYTVAATDLISLHTTSSNQNHTRSRHELRSVTDRLTDPDQEE